MSQSPFAQLARWLGFDRNPLRRPADRVEALVRLLAVLGIAVAVVLGVLLGVRSYGDGVQAEGEQARTRHLTEATLLEDVTPPRLSAAGATAGRARAEWAAVNGLHWTSGIEAASTRRAGDVVQIWTDDTGAPVRRPQDRETTIVAAVTVATGLPLSAAAALALIVVGTRLVNQRRARSAWEAQWTVVEPMLRINGR
jgi:hypothetical protein